MFKEKILMTELSDPIANKALGEKITPFAFYEDTSFVSTLRALLIPRFKEENEKLSCDIIFGADAERIVSSMSEGECFNIVVGSNTEELHDAFAEDVLKHEGWKEVKKVQRFFSKAGYVRCYMNESKKNTILYVSDLNTRLYHYLQSGIFVYFPWYFNDTNLTELEMKLIRSLQKSTSDEYQMCIKEISETFKLKDAFIEAAFKEFDSTYYNTEIGEITRDIARRDENLADLYENIHNQMRYITELQERLTGLRIKASESNFGETLKDYFMCSKTVDLENITNSRLTFTVTDFVEYYDEAQAKRFIENRNSYLYDDNPELKEKMYKLMKSVFIDKVIKLRVCAKFKIDIRGGIDRYAVERAEYKNKNAMPNPHLNFHSCMGTYVEGINTAIRNGNPLGAIEQCIASAKTFNFSDSTVMSEFRLTLWNGYQETNNRCFVLPTGETVTPREAVNWIEANEPKEEENE